MAVNLVDAVSGLFTNNVVTRAASSLGESEGGIQRAISGVIPAVLAGLLNKAGSDPNAPSNIMNMAREASTSGVLNNPGGLLSGAESGKSGLSNMASGLFGEKLGNVTNMIANFAGIKSSSASSLITMAAPAALGVVGKQASENHLTGDGILRMLAAQKDRILSAIPSGLNIASALGLGSLANLGNRLVSSVSGVTGEVRKKSTWVPVALTALAIALLLYFLVGRKRPTPSEAVTTTVATPQPSSPVPAAAGVASIKVKLPDGSELDALRGGIEDRLVAFLNNPSSQPGKDVWFDFDNLNFETGSARITAASQQQVNNIAAILKAYPKTKIKIGGYTDKTGDLATNKKLSQDRADAVVTALKGAGASGAQLLGGEGYGSEFATVPATASEDERKKDRRISVSVREK